VQIAVRLQAKGNPHGQTAGLDRLIWRDLGPLETLDEPRELLPNPGVEAPPLAALLAPADKTPTVEDIVAGTAAAGGEETAPDARVSGPPPGWPAEGFAVEQPELAHGGRRFFRLRGRERLLLSLAVVDVELPAIYRMGIWVRGQGQAAIRVRLTAAGYERLPDVESGSVRAGPEWRELTVEVPLALGDPRPACLEMMLDAAVDGELDIDDASLKLTARGAAE
jgi:hypothetical protein